MYAQGPVNLVHNTVKNTDPDLVRECLKMDAVGVTKKHHTGGRVRFDYLDRFASKASAQCLQPPVSKQESSAPFHGGEPGWSRRKERRVPPPIGTDAALAIALKLNAGFGRSPSSMRDPLMRRASKQRRRTSLYASLVIALAFHALSYRSDVLVEAVEIMAVQPSATVARSPDSSVISYVKRGLRGVTVMISATVRPGAREVPPATAGIRN